MTLTKMTYRAYACLVLGAILLVLAISMPQFPGDTDRVADRVERVVARRMATLEKSMDLALNSSESQWMPVENLPKDMVIYRYVDDTLQSWCNQFSLSNDDISSTHEIQRLIVPNLSLKSPLTEVGEECSYVQLGARRYVLRAYTRGTVKVIGGLEICRSRNRDQAPVPNSYLRLADHYSIRPLSFSGGSAVYVEGVPQFKVLYDSLQGTVYANGFLLLFSLIFVILGLILLVVSFKTLKAALIAIVGTLVAMVSMMLWGASAETAIPFFSGDLYSDGPILYSIGSVIILNLMLTLFCVYLSLARKDVESKLDTPSKRLAHAVSYLIYALIVAVYAFFSLKSVILHSRVSMELYKLYAFTPYTAFLYLSFISLLITVPLLLDMAFCRGRNQEPRHRTLLTPEGKALTSFVLASFIVGVTSIFGLSVESRSISRWAHRGMINAPSSYSIAVYRDGERVSKVGSYDFPSRISDRHIDEFTNGGDHSFRHAGYRHFLVHKESAVVVISRQTLKWSVYLLDLLFVTIIFFLLMSVLPYPEDKSYTRRKAYFQTRINVITSIALLLTMASLTLVSLLFVQDANENNQRALMEDKIISLQGFVQNALDEATATGETNYNTALPKMRSVSRMTGSDISLYSPQGRLLMSTTPAYFDQMMLGGRMNSEAYRNLVFEHKDFYISKEHTGTERVYGLYAPINTTSGSVLYLYSAYKPTTVRFEYDTIMHACTVVTVFMLLMIIALFLMRTVLRNMFKPLSAVGRAMNSTSLDTLEHIDYERDDEIKAIVDSYNKMVDKLAESSKELAQAERDKAWSGMARQIAHEIKNPLTPMKLQIQRMIRLRQKGDQQWTERFDEAAKVLLDHIDILSETANEFSTFAKLYTQEHVDIDLDALLQEEVSMFDARSDVQFSYIGLKDAVVSGPKPQLTRVFVNLINNAVQALEGKADGQVLVSLRNGSDNEYFEMTFEDNGAGVSEENVDKLFSPNFTTKSGGSGLGLAISRSILERSGASIKYSKSFHLGGACFTILYPKKH